MSHRKFALVAVVALLLVLVVPVAVFGQGPTYSSAYQVQNLEGETATVQVQYYNKSGAMSAQGSFTIDGNKSKTVFPFVSGDGITTDPGSFDGSAVLSSDRQIAAILNTQTSSSPFYGASTAGFSAGSTELSLPLIACNNSGFDTWFNIQAVGTGAAEVRVDYIPGSSGASGQFDTATIPQFAAKTFNQANGSTTGTKTCAELGPKFVGSAKVTSTNGQPIVASAMFLGTGNFKTLQGYNGFTSGSTAVNLPLIMANNSSFYTAIQIQNAGANNANITVNFSANTAGSGTPASETFSLAAGASKTLLQIGGVSQYSPSNDWAAFGKYVGGATITQNGTSEPLVAVVNQNSSNFTSLGSTYQGFNPAAASTTVNLPLIAANNSGFSTGVQIQAVSGNPTVTVDYSTNTQGGSLQEPANDSKALTTGQVWTLIQAGGGGGFSGVNNWAAGGKYVGSAKITVTGGAVVAIVNFNGPATLGDTFFTYEGFGQ